MGGDGEGSVRRAGRVRLLLLDVDGVLTDGRFLVGADGSEAKSFHSRDGLGIRLLVEAGITVGLVSGRPSSAVTHRAAELGLSEVFLGVQDKVEVVEGILERHELEWSQLAFVGDDLVDLPVLRRAGLAATVPEAPQTVREHAHLVTAALGGRGAVREVAEAILVAQGLWEAVVRQFTNR